MPSAIVGNLGKAVIAAAIALSAAYYSVRMVGLSDDLSPSNRWSVARYDDSGHVIVSAPEEGLFRLYLLDTSTMQLSTHLESREKHVYLPCFHDETNTLACIEEDPLSGAQCILLYRTGETPNLRRLGAGGYRFSSLAWTPSGKLVASAPTFNDLAASLEIFLCDISKDPVELKRLTNNDQIEHVTGSETNGEECVYISRHEKERFAPSFLSLQIDSEDEVQLGHGFVFDVNSSGGTLLTSGGGLGRHSLLLESRIDSWKQVHELDRLPDSYVADACYAGNGRVVSMVYTGNRDVYCESYHKNSNSVQHRKQIFSFDPEAEVYKRID